MPYTHPTNLLSTTHTLRAFLVYVGFDPTSKTVVVAHQGTNPSKIGSILVNADFVPDPLDPDIFPGFPSDIKVHGGYQDAHARTAPQILQAVQNELTKRKTNKVLVTGHSLGGALALLDGVFLSLNLPPTTELKVVTYGMPRVKPQPSWVSVMNINILFLGRKQAVCKLRRRSRQGNPYHEPQRYRSHPSPTVLGLPSFFWRESGFLLRY